MTDRVEFVLPDESLGLDTALERDCASFRQFGARACSDCLLQVLLLGMVAKLGLNDLTYIDPGNVRHVLQLLEQFLLKGDDNHVIEGLLELFR